MQWRCNKYLDLITIQKCQNSITLEHAYNTIVNKKCELYNETDVNSLEKYLWHGTSYENVKKIIQTGFDRSFCKTFVYGKVESLS